MKNGSTTITQIRWNHGKHGAMLQHCPSSRVFTLKRKRIYYYSKYNTIILFHDNTRLYIAAPKPTRKYFSTRRLLPSMAQLPWVPFFLNKCSIFDKTPQKFILINLSFLLLHTQYLIPFFWYGSNIFFVGNMFRIK